MYYQFNVSRNGVHLFTTGENTATTQDRAEKLAIMFRAKFPESEGYKVTVRYVRTTLEHTDI